MKTKMVYRDNDTPLLFIVFTNYNLGTTPISLKIKE
jgi:hypothetical protein